MKREKSTQPLLFRRFYKMILSLSVLSHVAYKESPLFLKSSELIALKNKSQRKKYSYYNWVVVHILEFDVLEKQRKNKTGGE